MIKREIIVLSKLDHTNIIKYVESFEDNRYIYIVTEFVQSSMDVADILIRAVETWDEKSPLLPVDDVRKIMRMVLSGVKHMHANKIVHRDLKPGNCLLDDKFQLNIIDFGLAIEANTNSNESNAVLGTPQFMAPEIF